MAEDGGKRLLLAVQVLPSVVEAPALPADCTAVGLQLHIETLREVGADEEDAALARLINVGRINEEVQSLLLATRLVACLAAHRGAGGPATGTNASADIVSAVHGLCALRVVGCRDVAAVARGLVEKFDLSKLRHL